MKIQAKKIDPKDFGSKVTTETGEGTTMTRVLCGVKHQLNGPRLEKSFGLKASYETTTLMFVDGSKKTVPSDSQVEIDPETGISIHVYYPGQTGLR